MGDRRHYGRDDACEEHQHRGQLGSGRLHCAGGIALFSAQGDGDGRELWTTDGTTDGTEQVRDIHPGGEGSAPQMFTALGGRLLFRARDAAGGTATGTELWATDGTTGGTQLVKDIYPGTDGSFPSFFTALGGRLLFSAYGGGVAGTELWATDGTADGTQLVKDINAGGGNSFPVGFTALGDELFFQARDVANGNELWATDGTAAGTRLVEDIRPGSGDSGPSPFTALGERLFFAADDATHGRELWSVGEEPAPSAPPASGASPAATAPVISGLRMTRNRFATRARKRKVGTAFRFGLSETAEVKMSDRAQAQGLPQWQALNKETEESAKRRRCTLHKRTRILEVSARVELQQGQVHGQGPAPGPLPRDRHCDRPRRHALTASPGDLHGGKAVIDQHTLTTTKEERCQSSPIQS